MRNLLPIKLAIVVSHPIQYYVPIYQRLAKREDVAIKVFYTWHAGSRPKMDHGFGIPVAWDIPLTSGYSFELVPNTSNDPGTHRFFGLRNPLLLERVRAWGPDVVHITGWAWWSHLSAMRVLAKLKVPTLFRGDSHLLDETFRGPRWRLKLALLRRVFAWPRGFLVTGAANKAYYKKFGVGEERLFPCPHSIDVARFSEPAAELEQQAAEWRQQLGISDDCRVLLYAGKFERKKRPLELMQTIRDLNDHRVMLVMVGGGELEQEVRAFAAANSARILVLPFQNQSRMPIVYRLGNLVVLPSAYNETWGLAVNEAMACGRPVLVSDRVGGARDLIDDTCGRIFSWADSGSLARALNELLHDQVRLAAMGTAAAARSMSFDTARTENFLMQAVREVAAP